MTPTSQVQTKPSTARPVPTYNAIDYLDTISSYNLNNQTYEMLEQARNIIDAGNYFHQTVGFPDLPGVVVGGIVTNYALGETKTGTIQVPTGSFLISICCFDQNGELFGNGGFKVRIFDKGTKAELFDTQYGMSRLLGDSNDLFDTSIGPMFGVDQTFSAFGVGTNNNILGPHYLLSPYIITSPGVIQIDTTNMDTNANGNYCQVVLQFAIPINNSITQGTTLTQNV